MTNEEKIEEYKKYGRIYLNKYYHVKSKCEYLERIAQLLYLQSMADALTEWIANKQEGDFNVPDNPEYLSIIEEYSYAQIIREGLYSSILDIEEKLINLGLEVDKHHCPFNLSYLHKLFQK